MMALGTISIMVRLTMLKYDVISSSVLCKHPICKDIQQYSLITSTSLLSRSDRAAEAFRVGGGGSIAAIFFLFFDAQKLPKNPELPVSVGVSTEGLLARGGRGLPVLGSTCVGLLPS